MLGYLIYIIIFIVLNSFVSSICQMIFPNPYMGVLVANLIIALIFTAFSEYQKYRVFRKFDFINALTKFLVLSSIFIIWEFIFYLL